MLFTIALPLPCTDVGPSSQTEQHPTVPPTQHHSDCHPDRARRSETTATLTCASDPDPVREGTVQGERYPYTTPMRNTAA